MPNYRLHIEGQVQGVGFRPYVYRIAKGLGLKGSVNNSNDGVHIQISGSELACREFIEKITLQPPSLARVIRQTVELVENHEANDFKITASNEESEVNMLPTPDLGLCENCRTEIKNSNDTRYEYAFTTCINCGPRYSIIQSLPFDRENTTMNNFVMCSECKNEYDDPENRRFYSQTNSCPQCGVSLVLLNNRGLGLSTNEIIEQILETLQQGKIIAVKGIGGFLLMVDATNSSAVQRLRERKHRPSKPFALLYPSLEFVEKDAFISENEKQALTSIESPIVLLALKDNSQSNLAIEQIFPGLSKIGVMLPYSPLLELISSRWGKPLVATSGNVSGSPIFYEDDNAVKNLSGIADLFVTNDRAIVVPQDDSVVQFAGDQRMVLRRSRGLAPTYLPNPFAEMKETIFASGSDMKSAFALLTKGNLYVSQYLGDLENFGTQESYKNLLDHFLNLFHAKPSKVLIDSHPNFYSSQFGKELALAWEAQITPIQHHLAHFSAVLAENNLMRSKEPILGVIWDGTGWGDDGQIWGSEFFIYDENHFNRIHHLDYFDHILGDKISREPRISALSLCAKFEESVELMRPKFSNTEWGIYNSLLNQSTNLKTSSMGRLFDGVASLLGLCDKSSYEGEAALLLENCAMKVVDNSENEIQKNKFSLKSFIANLVAQIKIGTAREILAYQFHVALVDWIEEVATSEQVSRLAFSGGVFQNALLNHLIAKKLSDRYELFFHRQLSCNDECIGFGQLAYHQIQHEGKLVEQRNFENQTI